MEAEGERELGNRSPIKDIETKMDDINKKNMWIILTMILVVNVLILGSVREIFKYIKEKIK